MQLDQARIAIRRRLWRDNLDLSLHVLRANAGPLALCVALGILPLALMNHAILHHLLADEFRDDLGRSAIYWLVILVMIEAPLATAPITLWLGQALFVDKPEPAAIRRALVACLPQLVLLQVVLRTLFILPVITSIVPYAMWPYLNEVILLERNPLRAPKGQLSTLRRNSLLHRGGGNDFAGQAVGALCLSILLVAAIYLTQVSLLETLFGFEPEWSTQLVELQLALWLVAIFFTVARFLSYLDQRTRREGWEVELLLRAERERLTRQLS